jgi:copper chaperone CopZ
MKRLPLYVLMLSLVSFAAHAETDKITVNGMVCAFCAQGLEKSFGKMDAVDKINVDLDNMMVTIKVKDGQTLDDAAIQKAIKDNGLDTVKIERSNS